MRRLIAFVATVLASCSPELGACDPSAARAVAYSPIDGATAFEGQALMITSCGGQRLCHGADADVGGRLGVPVGLEFDVRIASTTEAANEPELARLAYGRELVVRHAGGILHTIDLGTMPPGSAGEDVRLASYRRLGDRTELPAIGSPEGREILRNWLACGAPVVERTTERADGVPGVVVPGPEVAPIEPTWASIYRDVLVARRCGNRFCHGDPGASGAGLFIDPDDCDATYRALVGAPASGEYCGDRPGVLVAPGDPEASVFLHKLTPESPMLCGDLMAALRPEDLDAIRAWIEAGAPSCSAQPCEPGACRAELP